MNTFTTQRPAARAIHFRSGGLPVFGWLHAPAAAQGMPVLFCSAYGREEESSHFMLRRLAEGCAARGAWALRYDPPGTGDSAGDHATPDLVARWTAAVHDAIDLLRAASGAAAVGVVGLRAGALVMAQAVASRRDVAAYAALFPPPHGRAYVRELKLLRAAAVPVGLAGAECGLLETGGHALAPATVAALAALPSAVPTCPPPARFLVVDRDDAPAVAAAREHGHVEYRLGAGYSDLMQDPHRSELPEAVVADLLDWLADQAGSHAVSPALPAVLANADLGAVVETPLQIDAEGIAMFAIETRPASAGPAAQVVVLLNAGGQRHVGPGRYYVALARRLAAGGATVLRVDLPGLGDAPTRDDDLQGQIYPPTAAAELAALTRYVRRTWPQARCELAGICSGAFHALLAVTEGLDVQGAVIVNPLLLQAPGPLRGDIEMPVSVVAREMTRYRSNWARPQSWLKLLRGEVRLGRLFGLVGRRAGQRLGQFGRDLARDCGIRLHHDLARTLRDAARAGVACCFIFSEGDPGEDLLRLGVGRRLARMCADGTLSIHRMADADHTFTGADARERATQLIESLLSAPRPAPSHRQS